MIITEVSVHVNTVDTKEMLYACALHAGICKRNPEGLSFVKQAVVKDLQYYVVHWWPVPFKK